MTKLRMFPLLFRFILCLTVFTFLFLYCTHIFIKGLQLWCLHFISAWQRWNEPVHTNQFRDILFHVWPLHSQRLIQIGSSIMQPSYIYSFVIFTIFIENRITITLFPRAFAKKKYQTNLKREIKLLHLNKLSLVPKKLSLPSSLKKKKNIKIRKMVKDTRFQLLRKKRGKRKEKTILKIPTLWTINYHSFSKRNFPRDLPHKFTFYRALITISGRKRVECSTGRNIQRYNSRR